MGLLHDPLALQGGAQLGTGGGRRVLPDPGVRVVAMDQGYARMEVLLDARRARGVREVPGAQASRSRIFWFETRSERVTYSTAARPSARRARNGATAFGGATSIAEAQASDHARSVSGVSSATR